MVSWFIWFIIIMIIIVMKLFLKYKFIISVVIITCSNQITLSFDVFFLPFHWPIAHHVTCKKLPTYNCFAANNILTMRN